MNNEAKKSRRDTMKKILLGTVALVALGMRAPASAADLAARPYTKAPPPMIAAIYDWSGFYIGLNGGGGWSHKCWDRYTALGRTVPCCRRLPRCNRRRCRWPDRLSLAGRLLGVRPRSPGRLGNLKGSNTSLITTP